MELDLVIRDADLATAADRSRCDIGVRDGRVVALGLGLPRAAREIDAAGRLVTPGGVDAHCHLDQPMPPPMRMADDFESGTRSAACGGTTTVIPFAAQAKGQSLAAAVEDYHRRAQGRASIDYAFHLIVSDPTPAVLGEELPRLIREGHTSFKIYMTYDDLRLGDREILEVMDIARNEEALVMVHAENADCIAWLTQKLLAAGDTSPAAHARSRPAPVEREAAHRAITFAELVDVPILLVHVSGGDALEQIRWAQGRGLRIFAETCPQYLLLTAASLGHGFEGAKCVCSPPPRDEASCESVWRGLANGAFHIVSSDHAPFNYDDPHGKRLGGREMPFPYIPNGIPGLETRMPLLYSEGVARGRIDIHQFVAYTATNAARLYGLYPRKGTVAVGSDADLVVWDTEREVTITNARLHHAVDYTPYEGMKVRGWPATTLSRGEVVWDDGAFRGRPGHGRFLRCDIPDVARRRATPPDPSTPGGFR